MIRLFFISQLLFGVLTFALPSPSPIKAGDLGKAKPKNFVDSMPGSSRIGAHPLVVLTNPDSDGFVRVASISHDHPLNPPTRAPEDFGIHIDRADPSKSSGRLNVAAPRKIHMKHITPNVPPSTVQMEPHHLEALKAEMRKNCGQHVIRRTDQPDPCDSVAMERAAAKAWHSSPNRAKQLGFTNLQDFNAGPRSQPQPQGKSGHGSKSNPEAPANRGENKSPARVGSSKATSGSSHPSQQGSTGKGKAVQREESRSRSATRSSAGRKSGSPSLASGRGRSKTRSPSPDTKASLSKSGKTGMSGSGSTHHVETLK